MPTLYLFTEVKDVKAASKAPYRLSEDALELHSGDGGGNFAPKQAI